MEIVAKIPWNIQDDIVAPIPQTTEYKMLVILKMEHALDVGMMVWHFATSRGAPRTMKQYLPPCLFLSHANSTSLRLNSASQTEFRLSMPLYYSCRH
jgi:hypothetical protein